MDAVLLLVQKMATQFDPKRYLADFASAMNERDVDRLLAYYAEDAELEDPSTPRPIRGKDAIRQNFLQWSKAFGEANVNVKDAIVQGNDVALRYEMTGRHVGDLELSPGETIPATNRSATVRVAEFIKLDAKGKIVADRAVFDVASMMTQLGLLPSPQGAGGRAEPAKPSRGR